MRITGHFALWFTTMLNEKSRDKIVSSLFYRKGKTIPRDWTTAGKIKNH